VTRDDEELVGAFGSAGPLHASRRRRCGRPGRRGVLGPAPGQCAIARSVLSPPRPPSRPDRRLLRRPGTSRTWSRPTNGAPTPIRSRQPHCRASPGSPRSLDAAGRRWRAPRKHHCRCCAAAGIDAEPETGREHCRPGMLAGDGGRDDPVAWPAVSSRPSAASPACADQLDAVRLRDRSRDGRARATRPHHASLRGLPCRALAGRPLPAAARQQPPGLHEPPAVPRLMMPAAKS
jgi:hypothetical protein